jgi:hypothetical protein
LRTDLYRDETKVRALNDEFPEVQDPVVIPHSELSADALRGVIESFVLREGTDYGEKDFSLEQKVAHVMRQLERGEARVMFDPNTETVDIQVVTAAMRR